MSHSATRESLAAGRLDLGYLQSLFHGAGIAIIACEPGGRVVACNAAAAKLFTEMRGANPHEHVSLLFPERERPRMAELVESTLSTLEPAEIQIRLGGTETDPLEYAAWCTPVLEPDGTLLGVALWLRDITKRKHLQRVVRKNERLASLGKLAGAVAHHYNNLLCSIATSVEYAMNMNTMTAMRRSLQRSADAVARATDITRQLLAFAQADHREADRADLAETVRSYFERSRERFASHGIRLLLEPHPIPPVSVRQEHLLIVLENLVTNAFDVMPGGGTLTVSLAPRDENGASLAITDTGGGISPEDMEHLFEPFYTSKGVLGSGKSTNAGLGLAVVHGLVAEMRGTISATNVPGSGARFEIVLPIVEQEERAALRSG